MNNVLEIQEKLEKRNSHFDFQFTDEEYGYFMSNARLLPREKEVLNLRRDGESIIAISFELNMSESNVNKIIKSIKRKIIKSIVSMKF